MFYSHGSCVVKWPPDSSEWVTFLTRCLRSRSRCAVFAHEYSRVRTCTAVAVCHASVCLARAEGGRSRGRRCVRPRSARTARLAANAFRCVLIAICPHVRLRDVRGVDARRRDARRRPASTIPWLSARPRSTGVRARARTRARDGEFGYTPDVIFSLSLSVGGI